MRTLTLSLLVVVLAVAAALPGCEPTPTARDEPARTAKAPTPPAPTKRKAAARPTAAKGEPEPTKPATFAEAWDLALKRSAELDRLEPAATAEASRRLAADELFQASQYLNGNSPLLSSETRRLNSYGLTALAARFSRRRAAGDDDFKRFCAVVWRPDQGPEWIVRLMGEWATFEEFSRAEAVSAALNRLPASAIRPASRDLVEYAAGGRWAWPDR